MCFGDTSVKCEIVKTLCCKWKKTQFSWVKQKRLIYLTFIRKILRLDFIRYSLIQKFGQYHKDQFCCFQHVAQDSPVFVTWHRLTPVSPGPRHFCHSQSVQTCLPRAPAMAFHWFLRTDSDVVSAPFGSGGPHLSHISTSEDSEVLGWKAKWILFSQGKWRLWCQS